MFVDPDPTLYDIPALTEEDLLEPAHEARPPSITDYEVRALQAVDLAESLSDPINRFSVARFVVRSAARIARGLR
jgi:hypothetical protein